MGHPNSPSEGFLFFSFLFHRDFDFALFFKNLEKKYGQGAYYTHPFFPMKNYYQKEMGDPLERSFFVPHKRVQREKLVEAKIWSYKIEVEFSRDEKRLINIDPGMITLENFQLATFKSFSHRVYLSNNVYSDLNICFTKKGYEVFDWTYPDYKNTDIIDFIRWNRAILLQQLAH